MNDFTYLQFTIHYSLDFFNNRRLPQFAGCFAETERAGIVYSKCIFRTAVCLFSIFPEPAKDHFARSRLQDAGDRDIGGFADLFTVIINDNHRSVIEIRNTLIVFLAFF